MSFWPTRSPAKRRALYRGTFLMDTIRPSFHELRKPFEPVCVNSQKNGPFSRPRVVNSKKTGSWWFQSSRHWAWCHRGKRAEREAASAQREGSSRASRNKPLEGGARRGPNPVAMLTKFEVRARFPVSRPSFIQRSGERRTDLRKLAGRPSVRPAPRTPVPGSTSVRTRR